MSASNIFAPNPRDPKGRGPGRTATRIELGAATAIHRAVADWRKATTPRLTGFGKDGHPRALIETIAEDLLAAFRHAPLLDAYDVYQHLMTYWAEVMQDDVYALVHDGWTKAAQPQLLVEDKEIGQWRLR